MIEQPNYDPELARLKSFSASNRPEKAWEESRATCAKLLQTNQLAKASHAVHVCLRDAKRLSGKGSIQRGLGAELLGELCERLRRPDRAVKIYELALKELQEYDTKGGGQHDQEKVQALVFRVRCRRATALLHTDRKGAALFAMEEALSAVAGTDLCKTPAYRHVLWAAADVAFDLSLWSHAERYLLRFLAAESDDVERVGARLMLSRTYRHLNRANLALKVLEPALQDMYYASSAEYDQSLLAELTWERGLILKSQRRYEDSIADHEEAYRLFARSAGPEDFRAVGCLSSLAQILIFDGQLNRARLILDNVVATTRELCGEHSEETFIPLLLRGQLFLALQKKARSLLSAPLSKTMSKDEAADVLFKAELDEDAVGLSRLVEEHVSEERFLDFVHDLRIEHLYAARQYLLSAVHVYTVAEEHNHPSLIQVYSLLARTYKLLKNSHDAEQCLKKAQHISNLLAAQRFFYDPNE